jgi:hypothetical protein
MRLVSFVWSFKGDQPAAFKETNVIDCPIFEPMLAPSLDQGPSWTHRADAST